jgi:glycosyltransferase involved in cell wall biosynthesis
MHSGNLGLSQNLECLVLAAEQLTDLPDVAIVFVGDGVKRPALEALVRERGLPNVRFLPHQPRERLLQSFGSADVFLMSLRQGLSGFIVPSKLYGILAAGRPFIAAMERDSEAVLLAEREGCGLAAAPGDPHAVASRIRELYFDRARARRMGERAREVALRFDRAIGVRAYHELFRRVAGEAEPSPCVAGEAEGLPCVAPVEGDVHASRHA